jgi:hypothetical protein
VKTGYLLLIENNYYIVVNLKVGFYVVLITMYGGIDCFERREIFDKKCKDFLKEFNSIKKILTLIYKPTT